MYDHKEYMKKYHKRKPRHEYEKKYAKEHIDVIRRGHWRRKYGITEEEYNDIFNKQNGCCAICGTHQSELSRPLGVDHDHETGEIRGLLCYKCNTGLGMFRDNTKILEIAIGYLKKEG